MAVLTSSSSVWSIILAGGDGERIRPSIERWLGQAIPKQYCTFVGTRSMLQHTWDRADEIVNPERKITVIGSTHQRGFEQAVTGRYDGTVIVQPQNCNTAPGIFLPLTYVMARDPQAVVVFFPSDHFIAPEEPFVHTVRQAVRSVEFLADGMILLGVRPSHLELDYGWISVGSVLGWCGGTPIHRLHAFVEKPEAATGIRLMSEGGLWNTLIFVAKAEILWNAGWMCVPEIMARFEQLRRSINTPLEKKTLELIYREMPSRNFSRQVLQRLPEQLGVLELQDVVWSDWGRPERIVETLQSLGKRPAFPLEAFTESMNPAVA